MFRSSYFLILVGSVAVSVSGCSSHPCQQAAEHVQACFPEKTINQQALASCDEAQAEFVLSQSCEALAVGGGKAECNMFNWWSPDCWSGGSGSGSGELVVTLNECGEYFGGIDCSTIHGGLACTLVTVEDSDGNEVGRAFTEGDSFAVSGLAEGSYTAKVWRRDGSAAQMVDRDSLGGFSEEDILKQDAQLSVQVAGEKTYARFYFTPTERQHLARCSDLRGTISGSCDGAALDHEAIEWTWFVELAPLDSEGDGALTRSFQVSSKNLFAFHDLLPGSYRLSLHEMDIPSYERRNNPDYASLRRWYTEHEDVYQTTITVSEVPSELQIDEISVSCQ